MPTTETKSDHLISPRLDSQSYSGGEGRIHPFTQFSKHWSCTLICTALKIYVKKKKKKKKLSVIKKKFSGFFFPAIHLFNQDIDENE